MNARKPSMISRWIVSAGYQCRVMDARHYRRAKNGRLSLRPARGDWHTAAGHRDS
jgi:hypothetical protein